MDNILKERLVNRSDKNSFRFALICSVCGGVWESTPIPAAEQHHSAYIAAKQAACEEAKTCFAICRLCGDPACARCRVSLGEMTVCSNCAKRMTQ